ncbi:MAG: enoyl-[acyl-carrier-protein] reductase FabL [Dehalococcoidia bacterium]|nr:MAG: enoyl-[acyl-carrier-protein] reductase FabL [Dehalococcoidia bacterium]
MLKGKVALVTGSSRGIGRAIAMKLAKEGADVIINYFRRGEAAEQTAKDVEKLGVTAKLIKANVGDPEKLNEMFDTIDSSFGRLDIFISNAASGLPRFALDLDAKGWDWTMDINAKAFLLGAQRAAKLMEGRDGKIVTVTSLGSHMVLPGYAAIGVSKAALEALTRYLAIELAPKGICVNAVAASLVTTEAGMLYAKIAKEQMGESPSWQTTPAGRLVTPEDLANVVAFLCSEEAFMIRGQIITIDGGTTLVPFGFTSKGV